MTHTKKVTAGLTLGALGVVFGDIGTSPLYALHAVFGLSGQSLPINEQNVYGIISLIIWAITLVVTIKYVSFVMRADNEGEGGIIALIGLIKSSDMKKRHMWFFIMLGLVGVALFYGDSLITPAISVLSAVEGLHVVAPQLSNLILPVSLAVLAFLFSIQRYGTALVGRFFGPIMAVWFISIGLAGAWRITQYPQVLSALSPLAAIQFFVQQPLIGFVAMGAVTLAITGAEALYADMGHFGRKPIVKAWLRLVMPALLLCYLGQGALLLTDPGAVSNPFFLLFPSILRLPLLFLAALATLIASQAVISGAFSLTRQAVHLDFLPKMLVRHTSEREVGQVYLPFINLMLFLGVTLIALLFGSSQHLAGAYGMAVSITLAIDTLLFAVVMRVIWRKSSAVVLVTVLAFIGLDLLFVTSNLSKFFKGGWLPLGIACVVILLVTTWLKGRRIVIANRRRVEGSLQEYVDQLRKGERPVTRVRGEAVIIGHHAGLAPLALHAVVEQLHELHEKVVIVSIEVHNIAHIVHDKRAEFDSLGFGDDGICHVSLNYGYHDTINVPRSLKDLRKMNHELDIDTDKASYFVSLSKIVPTKQRNMSHWRKSLFSFMANSATSTTSYFHLPIERTVEMRSLIKL